MDSSCNRRVPNWNTARMAPVKYLLLFLLLFASSKGFAEILTPAKLIELAESGNTSQIQQLLDSSSELSIFQAQKFIADFITTIEKEYGFHINLEELKNNIFEMIENEFYTDEQKSQIKSCFSMLLNNSSLASKNSESCYYLSKQKKHSHKKKKENVQKEDISGGVIIGAVETLAGAILWITPFRVIGTGMMIDGVRRMLNSVEENEPSKK